MRTEIITDLKKISSVLDYVVIRNYEFLFNKRKRIETDLDIFANGVSNSQIEKVKKLGYCLVSNRKYRTVFAKFFPKKKLVFFLDIHKKTLTGNPLIYKIEHQLLINKKFINGVPVLNKEAYLSALLMRELISEGFKQKYKTKLVSLFNDADKKKLQMFLSSSLKKSEFSKIISLLENKNFKELNKIRHGIRKRFFLANPLKTLSASIYLAQENPRIVAVLGVDGSGKTTIVETCYQILVKSGINVKKCYMGRGKSNILPVKKTGLAIKKKADATPQLIKIFIYSGSAFVYYLDFLLRYIKLRIESSRIIIGDRFSSDILLMPNVPWFLRRLLYCFLPKANKYVYLESNIEDIKKRRPEHSLSDLKRQVKEFERINHLLKSKKVTNKRFDKTVEETLYNILSI